MSFTGIHRISITMPILEIEARTTRSTDTFATTEPMRVVITTETLNPLAGPWAPLDFRAWPAMLLLRFLINNKVYVVKHHTYILHNFIILLIVFRVRFFIIAHIFEGKPLTPWILRAIWLWITQVIVQFNCGQIGGVVGNTDYLIVITLELWFWTGLLSL